MMDGLGKDVDTETNLETGAKQSKIPYRSDLFPARAFLKVSQVLEQGAKKYGDKNWLPIPVHEHLNHVLTHLMAYLADDTQDEHLEHAACRIMMALERQEMDYRDNGLVK